MGPRLSHPKVVHEEAREGDRLFLATRVEVKNANILLLSEGEDRLGTLAMAVPPAEGRPGLPLSSILLGDRNAMLARLLAERLARDMNRIALVSVFVKTMDEREAGPALMRLAEKALRKEAAE